jgi:MFS family permease
MMVVLGMTMSLTQILLCNRFIALFGEVGTVIIGLLVRSLAFFAGSFSQVMSNPYGCIIGTCSIGVGGALMNPCITALITKSADELANVTGEGKAAYGKHLGRKESAGHCAKLLAPLIGGVGYDSLGLGVNCVGSVISFVTTLGALALVVLLPPHVRNMEQVPDASGVRSRAETDLAGSFMGLEASNAALGLSGRRHGDNNTPPGGLSRKSSYDSEGRDRFPSRDSLGGVPGYQRSMNAPRMLERILSEGAVSEMVPIEHDNPLPRNDR